MREKIPSEITELSLNDTTYKGCCVSIQPTLVNFFFGNNGSGKSTIGKAIKIDNGVCWKPGKSASDYTVQVYNQDFINANFQNYHNLPGVFTVNEINFSIQQQVEDKTAEKIKSSAAFKKAIEDETQKKADLEQVFINFQKSCWDKTSDLRTTFKKALSGKMKAKLFAEAVLEIKNKKDHDLETLKRLYDTTYSADAKKYNLFNAIADPAILDNLSGRRILSESIVSSSDTPFAQFVKAINATNWVQQGHENFNSPPNDKCPYCQQKLPDSFEEDIKACFDTQYQDSIKTVSDFHTAYRNEANTLFIPLQSIPQEIYPEIDLTVYNDKLAALKGLIASNIQLIDEKKSDPSKVVEIENTTTLLQEISQIITGFNNLINENNSVFAEKPKKQAECKTFVWELIAFILKDEIAHYTASKRTLEKEIQSLTAEILKHQATVVSLGKEIAELNKNIVNTLTTIDNVNTLLRDSGFQGFSLREKEDTPNVYEVIRPDESIAENLSEGERNFIAFLYFYHLVKGSESADGGQLDRIVVIDDPVSSMDSSSLFIVSALVREMIEICENNAVGGDPVAKGRFIKQIFILTHNTYFHREITYNKVKHYLYVNFYLISKVDNKSSIRLCAKTNPDVQTEQINYNPVQNSYASLWQEYKMVNSPIPLMNVIRRILEYYFLQLCGYDGAVLRKTILSNDNKNNFISVDANGKEDTTQYQMAAAMLAYINANALGFNDGINYVDECIDIRQSRETFKMIFDLMNQGQHYEMMMGA